MLLKLYLAKGNCMEEKSEMYKKDALILSSAMARQFITVALFGIAVLMCASVLVSVPSFWFVFTFLGISVVAGLLYLMHAIGCMHFEECDVYRPSLRIISLVQIISVVIGIILLCCALAANRATVDSNTLINAKFIVENGSMLSD